MSLPLMPGTEPVQAFAPAAPKPPAPKRAGDYDNGAVHGCNCPTCTSIRDAGPSGTVTGRYTEQYGAAAPSIQNALLPYPVGHPPGLVRGKYDFTQRTDSFPDSGLHGAVRWLNISTGDCFDLTGNRQWTFTLTDGVWADRNGTRFVPDPPIAAPPLFDWNMPVAIGQPDVGHGVRLLSGQYDPNQPNGLLLGEKRWLDPNTGQLYDPDGRCANQVSVSADGTWVTVSGLRWLPL